MLFQILVLGRMESAAADESPASEGETDAFHPAAEALVATRLGRFAAFAVHSTPVC
jgi:hypothetical protein